MEAIQAKDYQVVFGENGYSNLNAILKEKNYSILFVLVDSNTHEHCLAPFLQNIVTQTTIEIIEIDPGEEFKNLETCEGVWNVLSELNADRNSALINLGGGVVTDLGGFVACCFKRGIDFINIPTTLLAMVDACRCPHSYGFPCDLSYAWRLGYGFPRDLSQAQLPRIPL